MGEITRRVLALAFVGLAVAGGAAVRSHVDVEWNPEGIRDLMRGLGPWGPTAFVLLIAFRLVLLVPSQVVLVAAGICYGFAEGTLYGALGVTLSGLIAFTLARMLGGESLEARVPPGLKRVLDRAGRGGGGLLVAVGTGYPVGPMTAFHLGAGLTSMHYALFALALSFGATVRAGLFTYLGSSVVEQGLAGAWPALVPLVALLLPMLHRPTRRRLAAWLWGIDDG